MTAVKSSATIAFRGKARLPGIANSIRIRLYRHAMKRRRRTWYVGLLVAPSFSGCLFAFAAVAWVDSRGAAGVSGWLDLLTRHLTLVGAACWAFIRWEAALRRWRWKVLRTKSRSADTGFTR